MAGITETGPAVEGRRATRLAKGSASTESFVTNYTPGTVWTTTTKHTAVFTRPASPTTSFLTSWIAR
ncbi:hypothetical protein PISMIDRAFT_687860 [Pisolithus microcarpus 441]|uniref:Uncharacterized protein n=1 Tax=Pisolithus microcarpus 441 TaxID=765257 RepID=A0A0C9YWN1_9AGAM|nr:hypothetical protein PISMIDRAFT_687860 [Pisolithus microcarpus 441]